ncbi:hypothetical protein CHLRE_16g681250v5 [Chlamydomonas reinhardtii]|uniref:Uncharacterized protein n=1 Tax=Chlamydomonas reinhardtii TaxID=3055 RepID=A0A2K3CV18_CHLRE|nr:uncharacterized protein CHLRE_16g681250v5 [Chlamydomonas reinhardtii]PNW72133.1 hypothetical protein CHLRE_16g681250v5 [Chlamydomonas reinhardtii]
MSQLNALSTQGDSYTYQAADGQWVFLNRARPHFLSHLPLSGAFCLVELALPPAGLPPEALASFADELAAREKR